MKTFRFIGMALFAILMCVNFASCSNEEVVPGEPVQDKYITLDLGITGEYIELSESPLESRGTESDLKDLIGIEVFEVSANGTRTKYAYGIFTSLENVKIKLLVGQKYKFTTSIIVEGYGCYEHYNHSCEGFGYQYTVGDDFTYTSDFSLSNYSSIPVYSDYEDRFTHERFYGELEYTPTENGVVNIATKRTAYGVHYIASGLEEGYLQIEVMKRTSRLYAVEVSSETSELDKIYSFENISTAWQGLWSTVTEEFVNYHSNKQLKISWIKSDDSMIPLGTYDVTFKRNVKTTIRINLTNMPLFSNGITITREETALTDDENEYEISGGEIVEVPVNSEP